MTVLRGAFVAAVVAIFGLLVITGMSARAQSQSARRVTRISAQSAQAARSNMIGPLFTTEATTHTCTASVIDSVAGDLILTAAHCTTGIGDGARFVPGYRKGVAPFGAWLVKKIYVDSAWTERQDPNDDVAIISVSPSPSNHTSASVEDVVGENVLGRAPRIGQMMTVAGYGEGLNDVPTSCVTTMYVTDGFPSFDCDGFVEGTSGSPWVTDTDRETGHGVVRGIIGGPDDGGTSDATSFSPRFGSQVFELKRRAEADTALGPAVP